MSKAEYKCKYCEQKMQKFDFEMNNGYCGKCRNILDWKKNLDNMKDFKK